MPLLLLLFAHLQQQSQPVCIDAIIAAARINTNADIVASRAGKEVEKRLLVDGPLNPGSPITSTAKVIPQDIAMSVITKDTHTVAVNAPAGAQQAVLAFIVDGSETAVVPLQQ